VAVGDIDNDGHLDIYVTAFGPNILYRNNGDGTFTDVTAEAGVAGGRDDWSTSAGFFDFDGDGRLDLYVTTTSSSASRRTRTAASTSGLPDVLRPDDLRRRADRLYRNNGDGTFADVSRRAGIANPAGKGLGVVFCDVDGDGISSTSTSPTIWSATSSTATTATARSATSRTRPVSASI
jgi:enediyne biosynthesis protein E4